MSCLTHLLSLIETSHNPAINICFSGIFYNQVYPADSGSNHFPSRHAPDRTLPHPQTLRPPYEYPPSIHIPPPPPVPQQPRYLAEGTDWYVCIQWLLKLVLSLALIDWRHSCFCIQGSECGSRPASVPCLSPHSTLSALPDLSTTASLPQEHHLSTSGQSEPFVPTAIMHMTDPYSKVTD